MKVLHVIPWFYPAHIYGGPIQSVSCLCRHLARRNCDVKVVTTNANGPASVLNVATGREVEFGDGVHARYCRRIGREAISPELLKVLPGYVRWADIVHVTAVYSFPTIPTLLACKLFRKPVIWSPRGALQRWDGSTRLRVKAIWERICRQVAPDGMAMHVTSPEEAQESLEKIPVRLATVIPNAVEVPELAVRQPRGETLRLMFLGRIHPKKGIENLLEACTKLQPAERWSLVIAGTGDPEYVTHLKDLIDRLGLNTRVTMAGEIVGQAKTEAFACADVLVTPSFTENFGMVVAEGLAHAVPVIASKGMPWARLEENGCGLWVANDPETLAASIRRMRSMNLTHMGELGRLWMQQEFSWDAVAKQMVDLYEEVLSAHGHRHSKQDVRARQQPAANF